MELRGIKQKQKIPKGWKIGNLQIKNFKSIKDLDIKPARVNLFIGAPNVGKSNILEALSLLEVTSDSFKELIRYESMNNLFFDDMINKDILISTDFADATLNYDEIQQSFNLIRSSKNNFSTDDNTSIIPYFLEIKEDGDIDKNVDTESLSTFYTNIKKYLFKGFHKSQINSFSPLKSPFGDNLFSILQTNKELRQKVARFFTDQGLELVLVTKDKDLVVQRKKDDLVFQLPYSLTADTLQRMIFHFAAIHSNKNSVLLFEEPENHSFPAYIRDLGIEIAKDTDNQYFIATHSHYIFDSLIENTEKEDLAIFITYIEDYETKVHRLTNDEISELQEYGVNIFFNLNHYIDA